MIRGKNSRKAVAVLIIVAFAWFVHLAALPARAADNEAPGAIAKMTAGKQAPKKRSILPWILIGAGTVAVAAVLILVVFKTKYDIVGTWSGQFTNSTSHEAFAVTITFTGDRKSGTLVYHDPWGDGPGTYTVDGKNVSFTIGVGETIDHTGSFCCKDRMSGTWLTPFDGGANGTWTLDRVE